MRAYNGAENCENVCLFLLNNVGNKFDKNKADGLRTIETTDLLYSKISMVIVQIKYVKNSIIYLRKMDYL